MVPALAFFYGGMVSSSAVISTMMLSFVSLAIGAVFWSVRTQLRLRRGRVPRSGCPEALASCGAAAATVRWGTPRVVALCGGASSEHSCSGLYIAGKRTPSALPVVPLPWATTPSCTPPDPLTHPLPRLQLVGFSLAFGPPGATNVLGGMGFGAFDSSDDLRVNTNVSQHAFFIFQLAFNVRAAWQRRGVVEGSCSPLCPNSPALPPALPACRPSPSR